MEKARLIDIAVKTSSGPPARGRRGFPQSPTPKRLVFLPERRKRAPMRLCRVTPYYSRGPPQRGLLEFFTDLARRTGLPFLIYHIPGRAAVSVTAATFEAIAERCPNFVGLKNTDDNLALVSKHEPT